MNRNKGSVFAYRITHIGLTFVKYTVLLLSSFMAILPLYSCFIISFKGDEEIKYDSFLTLPQNMLNFDNYKYVFQNSNMTRAFVYSGLILVGTLAISTLCNSLVAYVIYRIGVRWSAKIVWLYLVASLIPSIALLVPIFQLMSSLNLINSVAGYILIMCGADIVSISIFSRYYKEIPQNIDRSALLDGCSYYSVFFRVHLPMLKSAFLTSAIIKGVYVYNEYYLANLYLLDKQQAPTVTTELYSFLGPFGNHYNIICAACIVVVMPALFLFIFAQKKIYAGFSNNYIK